MASQAPLTLAVRAEKDGRIKTVDSEGMGIMIKESTLTRRAMMKWSMLSASASAMACALRAPASAQDLGPANAHVGDVGGRDAEHLFTGEPVVGGGQMEIRLNQSIHTGDPHELEVARRMRPFDPLSWYTEWNRVAQINEEIAVGYEEQGLNVSAHDFYLRASRFHRLSIVYQEDTDETMMPGYMKYLEFFNKAWELRTPPFERVTINVDGNDLDGYFRKPGGPEGTRYPAVIAYQGADSLAENTLNGGGAYNRAWHGIPRAGSAGAGRGQAAEAPVHAARHRTAGIAAGRLPAVAAGRGPGKDRPSRAKHGRVFRTARSQRRKPHQGGMDGRGLP